MDPTFDEEPLPPLSGPSAIDLRRPPYRDPREATGSLKRRWDALEREDGFDLDPESWLD